MTYNVGDRIDLTHLNPPKAESAPRPSGVMALPSKLIPGSKVKFLAMAQGLIVMSVIEPPMVLSVAVN